MREPIGGLREQDLERARRFVERQPIGLRLRMTLQVGLELLGAGRWRAGVLAVSRRSSRRALVVSTRNARVLRVVRHFLLEAT